MQFRSAAAIAAAFLVCAATAYTAQFTQGTLRAQDKQGRFLADCPLKHTSVNAEIAGIVARVRVAQDFRNTSGETIEAVYTFPLPHDAAVDEMTMVAGQRVIQGKVKTREEARSLYETARNAGQAAALFEQERPNIFTQSVANVLPGDEVKISIAYTQTVVYEEGGFEFVFPMTVGPRYIPAGTRDAARIAPPVAPEGVRAGHDISIEVSLDAGVPLAAIQSKTHAVDVQRTAPGRALVRLRDQNTIPNKDFILRYENAAQSMQDVVMAHASAKGGFFALILEPPRRTGVSDVSPKELIFVLDTSGSMTGFPIEKAKEAMRLALDGLYPQDTFNLITFSGDTEILFHVPVPATDANVRVARLFLESRAGGGGTEMMKAIRAALAPSGDTTRTRVVCFMTDGFVGNDMEILAEVQRHPEARVFAFGIGQSVNRFLLDGMALYGRGEVEYVGLQDDGSAAARRFHQRVRDPLMTGISMDWSGLPLTDVHPRRIPDLFGAKPVIVTGRYTGTAHGAIRLRGNVGGHGTERAVAIDLRVSDAKHDVVPALWARQRIRDLMSEDYASAHRGAMRDDLRAEITRLGLEHHLATAFTSFVAVEERLVTSGGKPKRIEVLVEIPEGVSHAGVFGSPDAPALAQRVRIGGNVQGVVGGVPGGTPGGVIGGILGSVPSAAPPPPPPAFSRVGMLSARSYPTASKLDPDLVRLADSGKPAEKVWVQVLVRDSSEPTLDALRQIGFELLRPARADMQVVGRIAVERLRELAALPAVRYVVPWKAAPRSK